jgi:hypothetical protein
MPKTHLRDANSEQTVRLLVVVVGQQAEHLCQSSIIRTGTDKAHRDDGVERNFEVIIVRVL